MEGGRIGFIGAGKVGITLGVYFKEKGAEVKGYLSRDFCSARLAAQRTDSLAYLNISQIAADCDIIFITTPDDQIKKAWLALKETELENKIICHTSGALSADIFTGIKESGAYGYSLHPMYAFPDKSGNTKGLEKCFFTIEGDERRLSEVAGLIAGMGNRVSVIDSSKKALYHAANVLAANLLLSLLSIADDCLISAGLQEERSLEALLPLITVNLANIADQGFAAALTGPVERNDLGTVMKHLEVLPERYRTVYAELSLELIDLAKVKHPEKDYSALCDYLRQYMNCREEGN